MKIAILQSNYLPWKGYFHLIQSVDKFVFYDVVKYTKNDWRNRNRISSREGNNWISIPISADSVKLNINEVKLPSHIKWKENHINALYNAYHKAEYYYQVIELMNFLKETDTEYLSFINTSLIKFISSKIGINAKFYSADELQIRGDRVEKLVNVCEDLSATTYLSGPAAKDYLAGFEFKFKEKGITIEYMEYPDYPLYKHVHGSISQNLSIVDIIAHISWEKIGNYIWKTN